uniref:Uncharacterized protein n=1 Tax=Ditylenchus dipsaci TaxID=166011 RepID=A0A915DBP4_9BILA
MLSATQCARLWKIAQPRLYTHVMGTWKTALPSDANQINHMNYSEAWASRLVNFVEESHRFRAVHASVAESFVIGNKLVRQFLTSTLMLNSFGRSVRQTQRLIDNHCSDVSNMEAAPVAKMQMHIECNQSILYARTENTLGVTDLQPLLTAEKFHNFIHLLLLGLGALANIYVYILLQASTASLVPLPGPSSSA